LLFYALFTVFNKIEGLQQLPTTTTANNNNNNNNYDNFSDQRPSPEASPDHRSG
jgi:hypothetical protein